MPCILVIASKFDMMINSNVKCEIFFLIKLSKILLLFNGNKINIFKDSKF